MRNASFLNIRSREGLALNPGAQLLVRPTELAVAMALCLGGLTLIGGLAVRSVRLGTPFWKIALMATVVATAPTLSTTWRSAIRRTSFRSLPQPAALIGIFCGISLVVAGARLIGLTGATPTLDGSIGLVLIASVVLTSALISRQLKPEATVLVIGDPQFRSRIRRMAAARGRIVIGGAEPSEGGSLMAGLSMPELMSEEGYDELVVQEGSFAYVHEISPELRRRTSRVLIVPASAESNPFSPPLPALGRAFKRGLDLVMAPAAMLLLAPVVLLACVAIMLDSPGSPIFRQERLGADGRRFVINKLRTMRVNNSDAEHRRYYASLIRGETQSHAGLHKLVGDRRITRVGKWLRKLSIDELPQLVNVITGDMTLVGPRPPIGSESELYDARTWQRMRVKPGLTGLWQVSGRSQLNFQQMVELDIAYCQTWTPLKDLSILVRTPAVVIMGRGAA